MTMREHARAVARQRGAGLLRLDCYAGGDGALVAYYESVGFQQVVRFTVEILGTPYTGCLLQQRLAPGSPAGLRRHGSEPAAARPSSLPRTSSASG
jgi:hypothetical protein